MAPSTPKLRFLRNRPLCIICARPAEADNIAKSLGIEENRITGDQVQKVNNGYTFYFGSFTLDSKEELEYYVTSSLDQGIQSFTVSASVLFSILRPRFVIHAGVCAGYYDQTGKLKMDIAHVIFGEAATNYQEGKMEDVDGQLLFRPHYKYFKYDAGDMQAFAEAKYRPTYHYGDYLSGSSVRTDANLIFERIRGNANRNAIALDMEASAFLQLCTHFQGDQVISLGVIKGISDFGNPEKGSIENAYEDALKNTAKALKEWVLHRIRAITWTMDESDEPAAHLLPGYYGNFIRRVLDNHLMGWPITDRYDPNRIIPSDCINGLKTVLPKGNDPFFFKELNHIRALVKKYHVDEVNLGGQIAPRYLYYRGGYLIDFARTVNSLTIFEDREYQVGVFGRLLSAENFYTGSDDTPALASVVSWESTVEWLEELEAEEQQAAAKAGQSNATHEAESRSQSESVENAKGHQAKERNQSESWPRAEDQINQAREGRPPRREDPPTPTVLGEERKASPTGLDNTTASTATGQPKDSQPRTEEERRSTTFSKRRESKEPKDKRRSKTTSPKRVRNKESADNKRSLPLSPPKRPHTSKPPFKV